MVLAFYETMYTHVLLHTYHVQNGYRSTVIYVYTYIQTAKIHTSTCQYVSMHSTTDKHISQSSVDTAVVVMHISASVNTSNSNRYFLQRVTVILLQIVHNVLYLSFSIHSISFS